VKGPLCAAICVLCAAIGVWVTLPLELSAQSAPVSRSICVAPAWPTQGASPDLGCRPDRLSLKIDRADTKPWSRTSSAKIEGLDVRARHKVVVMCEGKPQQSFRFSFSEFKSNDLCLFLDDLYATVQLWERRRAPWCRCE